MTHSTALVLAAEGDGWSHPWWPVWLVFWVVLAGAVAWFVLRRRNRRGDPLDRARGLLAERYAAGELGAEEYRERLETLRKTGGGA